MPVETTSAPVSKGRAASTEGRAFERTAALRPAPPMGREEPLPAGLRISLENVFEADLSELRWRQGELNSDWDADAAAQGNRISFAPGSFDATRSEDRQLLGHEIAHVLQQRAGEVPEPKAGDSPVVVDARLEREAEAWGDKVARLDLGASLARGIAETGPSTEDAGVSGGFGAETSAPIQLGDKRPKTKKNSTPGQEMSLQDLYDLEHYDSDEDSDYEDDETVDLDRGLTLEEQRLNQAGQQLDMTTPRFRLFASNAEKYGKSTQARAAKRKDLAGALVRSQATLGTFSEITDAGLFQKELGDMNLGDMEVVGGPRFASQSATGKEKGVESYVGLANTAELHDPPTLSVFPGNSTTEVEPYDGSTLPYGKAVDPKKKDPKSARPTTFWTMNIPAGRYNLRPARKGFGDQERQDAYAAKHQNLAHRNLQYETVHVVNVHTSPSISTIGQQTRMIEKQMRKLAKKNPNVVAKGDFYMQKGAPSHFAELQASDTFSVDEPGVETNFPGKGKGQTADHFLSSRAGMENLSTTALGRPSLASEKELDDEEYVRKKRSPKTLKAWTSRGVDHAPVVAEYRLVSGKRKLRDR